MDKREMLFPCVCLEIFINLYKNKISFFEKIFIAITEDERRGFFVGRNGAATPLGEFFFISVLSLSFCGGNREIERKRERERSFTVGQTFVPANKKRSVTSVIGRM